MRTDLDQSPQWHTGLVWRHTSGSWGQHRLWWTEPHPPPGESGTVWSGGACSCSHRQSNCHIHSPPKHSIKSFIQLQVLGLEGLQERSAHLNSDDGTAVLVEVRLHHGQQLPHPIIHRRHVIWKELEVTEELSEFNSDCLRLTWIRRSQHNVFLTEQPGWQAALLER